MVLMVTLSKNHSTEIKYGGTLLIGTVNIRGG